MCASNILKHPETREPLSPLPSFLPSILQSLFSTVAHAAGKEDVEELADEGVVAPHGARGPRQPVRDVAGSRVGDIAIVRS